MDKISAERRSANMRAIRSKDTKPEIAVRKVLRRIGFAGYRLHHKKVLGRPDIAFIGKKKAIFVHGCFWHGHDCRHGVRRPLSRIGYWGPKIDGNQARDARHRAALEAEGWDVLTLWACETVDPLLGDRLVSFLTQPAGCSAL